MQPVGAPRTELDIVDDSVLVSTGLKGIVAVIGITEMGEPNKPKLIGSWPEYRREFGGFMPDSVFPLLCYRAFAKGGRLLISRVAHYTDIEDITTIGGVKASGNITETTHVATFTAKNIGKWGNRLSVALTNPSNGGTGVDITVSLAGTDYRYTYPNFPSVATLEDVAKFNAKSKYVNLTLASNLTMPTTRTSITLASGAQVLTDIVANDYIGSEISNTGLHSFNESNEAVKIGVPAMSIPAIDIAIMNYVEKRKNMLGVVHAPFGVDAGEQIDYREGTGTYNHNPIDSWRMIMTSGGLGVDHPTTGLDTEITEAGDAVGIMSAKDNKTKQWFSFAGPKRGVIKDAKRVLYNVGVAARQTQADQLDSHGINPVVKNDFGIVFWGNRTMLKADSLLKHANVAELMIALTRALLPLVQSEMFDPNDIETWGHVYRRVKPYMESVVTGRGIWRYLYQGDQDIDDISQAKVNDPLDVDAGKYVFNLFIAPKVGMLYQGIRVILENSSVSFEDISAETVN